MTKPTGRPRGRPKTKHYTTLMARVDMTLADQVKRYAALHRQPLSVVMRDALALFMEEYPAGGDRTVPHQLTAHDFLSDRYEAPLDMLLAETDSAERDALVSDTNEVVIQSILSDTNADAHLVSDTKTVSADIVSDTNIPSYDPAKFTLGALCKQHHNFDGQGHSLRYVKGDKDCHQCRQARSARNAAQASQARAKRKRATRQGRQGT
jgi:hypothetical protein